MIYYTSKVYIYFVAYLRMYLYELRIVYVLKRNVRFNKDYFLIQGTLFLYTKQKTLFYAECKLGDLNANWIPILSVSIFASYNFTPLVSVPTDCMSKMSSQCIYSTNRMVPLYFLFLYSCNLIAVYN